MPSYSRIISLALFAITAQLTSRELKIIIPDQAAKSGIIDELKVIDKTVELSLHSTFLDYISV